MFCIRMIVVYSLISYFYYLYLKCFLKIGFYEKLSAAASPAARLHDAAGSSTDERTARNAAGNGTTTATADAAASLYADAGLDSVCSVSGNPLFIC